MGRCCVVSYIDANGVEHQVEVVAESLYEAGLRALAAFRRMPMNDGLAPGPATRLRIEIRGPEHCVPVGKLLEWLEGGSGKTPREHALKAHLRELIAGRT